MRSPAVVRIPTEASQGLERRSSTLQTYLETLHEHLEHGLGHGLEPVGLQVLSESDWQHWVTYPYGFTFYRRLKTGAGLIFAPSDYPARLLWAFKAVVVRSQLAAPGSLEEFLDLTLGHELGHAVADQLGLRTRVRWLDEFLATYLYLAGLRASLPDAFGRVVAWANVFSSEGFECALANPNLTRPSGNRKRLAKRRLEQHDHSINRTDLGAFEYPLVRLPLANQAWYQARFTLRAAELLEARGFEFVLTALETLPTSRGRGGISRAVLALEPSFKDWFASFGNG